MERNFLFFVYDYKKGNSNSGLQKDLINKIASEGNNVYIISMTNRDTIDKTFLEEELNGKIKIAYVNMGEKYGVNSKIKKGLILLKTGFYFKKAYNKFFNEIKIDVIIGYAPYNTNISLVKELKRKNPSLKSFLMVWDFFPDNAVDLGIMKKRLIYNCFKYKELKIFKSYDILVLNSKGALNYINDNYKGIENKNKILIRNNEFLNTNIITNDENNIIKKFGYNKNDFLMVFGGNIGVAQQLENFIELVKEIKNDKLKIIIVGYGTEKEKIKKLIEQYKLNNVNIMESLEKSEYEELIKNCNAGIISLNKNFTVPNTPTKLTTYLKYGKPIFALLDQFTKNDLGELLVKNDLGIFAEAGNLDVGVERLNEFLEKYKGKKVLNKSIEFYRKEFDINISYKKIVEELGMK